MFALIFRIQLLGNFQLKFLEFPVSDNQEVAAPACRIEELERSKLRLKFLQLPVARRRFIRKKLFKFRL